jgi:hypothetical protein
MKSEINRDYYCSTAGMEDCPEKGNCSGCPDCRHKWPTPEQFKEEYREEYPDDGLVWYRFPDDKKYEWLYIQYAKLRAILIEDWCKERDKVIIVCACTPFGKPDYDWKPE